MTKSPNLESQVEQFKASFTRVRDEMMKMIVGQKDIVEGVLIAFFAGGHVLLEGVPGLGKTMLVRTLAEAVNLKFARVQFTPDLMPADIVGTNIITEGEHGRKQFTFQPGPVFANILLADEINRATPKTQSALLEAMQEQHVTVGGTQHPLDPPFLVLATQNPLEMEGTYPLPEAQLDRFFFKLKVMFPTADDLQTILDRTTVKDAPTVSKVLDDPAEVLTLRNVARQVPLAREIQTHAIDLVLATHPDNERATPLAKKYVRYGASPRGAQALILAGKIHALLDGRYHVSRADIDQAAAPALRHRIILNFEGEAEGTSTDQVIAEILKQVRGLKGSPAVKASEYLKRIVHEAGERLKKVPAAPGAVAGGVALGIFWSFTPLLGLKNLLSIFSAWLCRCSKIAAVLAVSAHDIITPLWPFILRWEYDLGFWFLHHHFPHRLSGDILHLKNWFNADLLKILWPTFLGSLVFAVPSALLSYWIVDRSLRRYRRKHPDTSEPHDPAPGGVSGP